YTIQELGIDLAMIGFYSLESSLATKSELKDIELHWKKYNILIYTSTVLARISFESEHYHHVFAYFTRVSTDPCSCMQMLGHVRNVKTKNYNIYIRNIWNNHLDTKEEIEDWLLNKAKITQKDQKDA